ncbi:TlpA family protein disulfide reductase [Echinicola vietnamensis]|uniref:Thiol-disulfide isomerase-like thioredoxin n=1 Tax=Echinicola vietnamensis (strain DSM 17526 / LMG 23754 / KMM 6221) TaxID=926556 RepID=L0G322_ECHVK|nr:TlpA disulfide reductase family protein [Echinicola vietnamensis]AGA79245.1 thiol-disulfide isomerase-like thioredoxin [Echinicola vietnamensis DSM 17526]
MKKTVSSIFLAAIIFLISFYSSAYVLTLSRDFNLWGFGALLGFMLILAIDALVIRQLSNLIPSKWVISASLFGILLFAFISLPSLRFAIKVLPTFICLVLGSLAAAIMTAKTIKNRYTYGFSLFLFPFVLNLSVYDTWVHYIEFGNTSGQVTEETSVSFKATDEKGHEITNEQLKGKVVLLDFWFIGCAPCWKKFPDLQQLHEQYLDHPDLAIYAMNRPMSSDRPGQAFEAIRDKGYTFNVLQGTQKIMDDFGVYVYPTVVVLNKEGSVVYMGSLDRAQDIIESLL